jgi:hypothetical protein
VKQLDAMKVANAYRESVARALISQGDTLGEKKLGLRDEWLLNGNAEGKNAPEKMPYELDRVPRSGV